jgi:ethanolamine utilization protein EutA
MHDLEFEHLHTEDAAETRAIRETIWAADNVELTTVGIDIGSSTSHLMFARVHLSRLATGLSSRFVVVDRKILWQSPILLTPYLTDFTIDTAKLSEFINRSYAQAGLTRGKVDSGAVILTGEALKRKNARAIADLFSEESGKFVCASAGHHMECQMAAHGSGAVKLSASRSKTVLNVDIGGGTTKLALIKNGELLASVAIAVGGRLIVEENGRITRLEEPAIQLARELGIDLKSGGMLSPDDRTRIVARMSELVIAAMNRSQPDKLLLRLLVTEPWPPTLTKIPLDAVTFSGGVAEYIYGRETARFGDLGFDLAHELRHALAHKAIAATVWDPGQGIRATVIGASQFSVQTSGNTIMISDPKLLPLHNLPVMACRLDLADEIDADAVTARLREALVQSDMQEGEGALALSFRWQGDPSHARLAGIAKGICTAVPRTLASGLPLVLLIDGDIGLSLGRIMHFEVAPGANVIAIDGVELKQFDYVDIGAVIDVSNVVIVIIKSLLFR